MATTIEAGQGYRGGDADGALPNDEPEPKPGRAADEEDAPAPAKSPRTRRRELLLRYRDPHNSRYLTPYSNGNRYNGTCRDGVPHGFGRKDYQNGDWYSGDWKLGEKHGCGVFFERASNTTYDGEWRSNRRDGVGISRRTRLGLQVEYEGRWAANVKHGRGIMRWPDGRVVKGVWANDELVKVLDDNNAPPPANGCIDVPPFSYEFKRMQLTAADLESDSMTRAQATATTSTSSR